MRRRTKMMILPGGGGFSIAITGMSLPSAFVRYLSMAVVVPFAAAANTMLAPMLPPLSPPPRLPPPPPESSPPTLSSLSSLS